jgi:hypothetical protein
MKFEVYFANKPNFGAGKHPDFNDKNYHIAAEVEAKDLNELFAKTQNIDGPWIESDGVEVLAKQGFIGGSKVDDDTVALRSMSVGDVAKDVAGQIWRCELLGWKEIK